MRKMLMLFALIASFSFAVSPVAMAQDAVDFDAISKTVMDADLETLKTDLETPMTDEQLPESFSEATYVDPEMATGDEGVLPASDLEDSEGSVAYMVTYEPGADAGTPAKGDATPDPLSGDFAVRIATLNYVFFGHELSGDDLDDFKSGAEEGLGAEDLIVAGTSYLGTVAENAK